jgi:flagellar basal body rod protein FlgG
VLRLFPISLLILALIVLRLGFVYGWFSTQGQALSSAPARQSSLVVPTHELTADEKTRVERLAREALTAPTAVERSAAALAAADFSTAKITGALGAIHAAEDVVMENIRHADTIAFKAVRWTQRGESAAYALDLTQGSLKSTGSLLDVAIRGEGFLGVRLPDASGGQVAYTRAGNLCVNAKNEVVVGIDAGYPVIPAISIPTGVTDITIDQNGVISVIVPGSPSKKSVGRLALTRFANASTLTQREAGIFVPTPESGAATVGFPSDPGFGAIHQGFLEQSNVDVISERMRLKFLNNWRAAVDQAISANSRGNLASTN